MSALLSDTGSHLQVLIPILFITTALIIPLLFRKRPEKSASLALLAVCLGFVAAWALFSQVIGRPDGYLEYFLGHSWNGERFLHSGQPIGIVLRTDIFGALLVLVKAIAVTKEGSRDLFKNTGITFIQNVSNGGLSKMLSFSSMKTNRSTN